MRFFCIPSDYCKRWYYRYNTNYCSCILYFIPFLLILSFRWPCHQWIWEIGRWSISTRMVCATAWNTEAATDHHCIDSKEHLHARIWRYPDYLFGFQKGNWINKSPFFDKILFRLLRSLIDLLKLFCVLYVTDSKEQILLLCSGSRIVSYNL